MPSGIILKNETNLVTQIDTTPAPVLALRNQGTATLVVDHPASRSSTGGTRAKYVDITIPNVETPLIAIYGPQAYGLLSATRSGTTLTARIIGYQHGSSGANPPFQWLHFDRPQPASSGGVFQINDSTGKCVFSAIRPPMLVHSMTKSSEVALPSNRKWAIAATSAIATREWSDQFTNLDVITWWETNLTLGYAETSPSPYDANIKRAGYTYVNIDAGSTMGSPAIPTPSGDLGGYGTNSAALLIDVTDIIT